MKSETLRKILVVGAAISALVVSASSGHSAHSQERDSAPYDVLTDIPLDSPQEFAARERIRARCHAEVQKMVAGDSANKTYNIRDHESGELRPVSRDDYILAEEEICDLHEARNDPDLATFFDEELVHIYHT